ncbi:hypothetical protein [Roseateles sp. LKC17W]|uniref:Uncharacterized protein n=1 Tax=Pelomonas margarita TaxID=3299031 RepID=A0ABW7FCK3_9BURK
MTSARLPRLVGTVGAALTAGWLLAEIIWFYGFTRFYFPGASALALAAQASAIAVLWAYCLALAITRRWQPWRRQA